MGGSLASVRPAFMDEYEQLEQELERYYEQYVGRFRNLDYLEHEVDVLNRREHSGQKRWMPPSGVEAVDGGMDGGDDDDVSSDEGSDDSDPPISVGGSDESAVGGDQGRLGG